MSFLCLHILHIYSTLGKLHTNFIFSFKYQFQIQLSQMFAIYIDLFIKDRTSKNIESNLHNKGMQ